ncbi:MAG: hypothetical protein J6T01_03995 [Kiritimatiellae bacterium]|nr:hypothetical protein [Kiritimatiellia bacterium]
MKLAAVVLCSACVFAAAADDGLPSMPSDTEVWNAGVDCYRRGDVTNALLLLKPLLLSQTHGPRAAEVVAKLEFERGDREAAADAAQIALRAAPDDPKANRNFTRAVSGLAELRENKRVEAVLKSARGKDPGSMMEASMLEARRLMAAAGSYRTNAPAAAVAAADALSSRATKLADSWIPLREIIVQSVTNEEEAATMLSQLDQAQKGTEKAAVELGDMNPEAYASLSGVEHDFTRFFKRTVLPPPAIAADLVAQSNAWQDAEEINGRNWQQDALDYTRAFRSKFPAWAQAYEQQAQADTNRPPFTKEDQAKISALATELEKIQIECCGKTLPPQQVKALDLIRKIQELLPKNGGGGNQQNQNQNQNQNQDKDRNKDQSQQQQQPQQSDQRQEQDPDKQQPEPEPKDGQPEEKPEDQEIEAILKKAQERNDEHEAEKKARMRKAPLPPNERDW